jgi:hypothetical protein
MEFVVLVAVGRSLMQTLTSSQFQYIQEWDDDFLSLFPHRFDYIWAPHPNPGEEVEWKTESRHPLSDRLIRQGSFLYGVRFGAETNYCLLDIDAGSPYHPKQDPFAISRIVAALEPIGLVAYIACSSSYSGGLHLYLPFQQTQTSWNLAIGLVALLESSGFKINPGHLEVFPNPRPYLVNGSMSLFNAHRLPLQQGSYLLNEDFHPVWSDQRTFLAKWRFAQSRNDINAATLKRVVCWGVSPCAPTSSITSWQALIHWKERHWSMKLWKLLNHYRVITSGAVTSMKLNSVLRSGQDVLKRVTTFITEMLMVNSSLN